MSSTNIALHKFADANSYVYPYTAAKAVDGTSTVYVNRWLSSSPLPASGTPAPNWLRIDLGAYFFVNRWVVKQMGLLGWSPSYNLTDYKLQGSLDNTNWFDIDLVTNNSANSTDRATTPTKTRWVRIYITKGLRCNTNFASIADLEIYAADPTSSYLSGLTISPGTLVPDFVKTTYAYTTGVGYDTTSMTVTPTVEDSRATIKVNGIPATSGQPFTVSNLIVGTNTVMVEVTPFIGDPQIYVITVTRASSPYLTKVDVKYGGRTGQQTVTVNIDKNNTNYSAAVAAGTPQVTVTPYAEDSNATILVNNQNVPSGQPSSAITLTGTSTPVTINVTSAIGIVSINYTITITKSS